MVIFHCKMAPEIIKGNARFYIMRGIDINFSIEYMRGWIGGINMFYKWLGYRLLVELIKINIGYTVLRHMSLIYYLFNDFLVSYASFSLLCFRSPSMVVSIVLSILYPNNNAAPMIKISPG